MISKRLVPAAIVLVTLAAIPTTAAAQQIGVKAGVNSSTLANAEEFEDSTRRIGLVGGLFVTVPVADMFSFQIEGLYSEKGISIESDEEDFEVEGDIRLRYLEVPVLGRADFGSGSSTRVYAVAGAAPAFKLGARIKVEALDEEETEDISDDVESFDLGLVGGLGVAFGNASIEARYTHGLMSIAKDDESDDKTTNRVVSVTVGYRFR